MVDAIPLSPLALIAMEEVGGSAVCCVATQAFIENAGPVSSIQDTGARVPDRPVTCAARSDSVGSQIRKTRGVPVYPVYLKSMMMIHHEQ